ncbi:hypothetical protein F5Y19DRAFT_459069 [Xylariaceae sp. FL1651]|nr:hypothetical protein F5Y19DRAFT_459069 [Xylariaceae sp. FL1651]
MTFQQSGDLGSTSLPDHIIGKSTKIEMPSPQMNITKAQVGLRNFSLVRRIPSSSEGTWGAYGLNLLYDPPNPLIDMIFVHGLRGGSIKTWCKDDDLKCFWPQAWLPREEDLQNVRVHSFGYNADWADMKETTLDLHDFGRALLAEMNTSPSLRRSRETPILLVGHSMGGLVIKKAYILAQQDPGDHFLANRIQCMFFLATPHRGSDSAKLLNNILRASAVFSSRQYITDIFKGSPSLQIINDEFRAYTDKVQLWSFYETLKTKTSAVSSMLIVDRDSAVLGYKGEMAQPLNADHRSICKFDSPTDPNYITIRNSLSKAVENLLDDVFLKRTEETTTQIRNIETFLMISYNAEDDLITAETNKTEGTCEWVINLESFKNWRDSASETSKFFWLTGEPGSGKTVLAAHIARHLQSIGADVCFHFFHHGRKTHQSISGFLRQIAYQMALHHPSVRQSLYAMQKIGVVFDKDDERTIWRKFFMNEIFNLSLQRPQYWIVDGFDECVDASKLFSLIAKFDPAFPIRFCFITRKRPDFDRHFSRFEERLFTHHIDTRRTLEDIGAYIRDNTTMLPVDEEENGTLIDRIVKKSRGIFLWAKLALEELEKVYSDEHVDDVLDEMPEGMVAIYSRILDMMATNTREIKLTKAILTWVVCGVRSLSILELQAALKLDLTTSIRSVERSVEGLCGQLLRIDRTGSVHVIHTTVQDFLLDRGLESPLAIRKDQGHQRLALVCLQYLVSDEMRPPRNQLLVHIQAGTTSIFADYACTLFSEHVIRASAESDEILVLLHRFFRTNVLTWIEFIARHKQDLFYVIRTARNLRQYLERRIKYTFPLDEHYRFIEQWTSDLIRIVAKFTRNLIRFPSTVFYLVAPLCPADSAIYLHFKDTRSAFKLSHSTGHTGWDDCVSYIDYRGIRALSLAAGDNVFVIGQKTGNIKIYETATCQEKAVFTHGEPVQFLKLDNSSQRLLASGSRKINMFNIDGELLWTFAHQDAAVAASFSAIDDTVTVVTRGSSVIHFSTLNGGVLPSESLGKEDSKQLKAATRQAIFHADISPDLRIMAIVYRGRPVQLWSLERDISIGACWFKRDTPGARCMPISQVLFNRNPAVELLAVASQDGELAIFDPWTRQEIVSVSGEAYILACAPDGRTLATGDMRGTIKLWDFDTLQLLYCIKSDDYEVRSLAFSGDGFRLYDIREAKTKVWEPSALVRKSLSDESSISESFVQPATVVDLGRECTEIISITAMGAEQLTLVGKADGSVVLFDTSNATLKKTLYSHPCCLIVTHVSWSTGGYVASTDASSVLQVWATSKGPGNTIEADQKVMEVQISSSIRSIALSPDGSKLLVCETSSDSIYWIPTVDTNAETESAPIMSVVDGFGCASRTWAWLPRPLAGSEIAMVSDSTLYFYQTNDTARGISLRAKAILTFGGNRLLSSAHTLTLTKTSKFLAVDLEKTREVASPKLLVYCLEQISCETERAPGTSLGAFQPLLCLHNKTIRMFIGWHDHALLFLDTDLWICSIDMASVKSSENPSYTRRRHLFIPYELIGGNNDLTPVLASETSIVFPREKSLSIIEDVMSSIFMSDEIVGQ